jgi:outer membrane protein TolC
MSSKLLWAVPIALGVMLLGSGSAAIVRAAEPAPESAGVELPLDVSLTPAEAEAAQRRRDLVMPRLWTHLASGDPVDPLVVQMAGYVGANPRSLAPGPAFERAPQDEPESAASVAVPAPPPGTLALDLDRCIELALTNNLDVQVQRLTMEAVAADVAGAKAKFHPTVGVGFTESEEETAGTRTRNATAFLTEEIPTGGVIAVSGGLVRDRISEPSSGDAPEEFAADVAVSIVQPLMRGGRIYVARQPIRDAEYDLEVEKARLRLETLRTIVGAKRAYYEAVLARRIIEVTEEAIERDHALIEASRALFAAGLVTQRDVFSAEILLASDRAKLAEAEADLELARFDLLDVLGFPPSVLVELADRAVEFEPIELETDAWVAAAVRARPEVYEIQSRMQKAELTLSVARNARLPQVDAIGSYGRNGAAASRDWALRLHDYSWSAGLVLSVPLGSAQARAAARRAELEQRQLERELLATERLIERQVRSSAVQLYSRLAKIDALTVGKEQSEGLLEIAKERFALGLATNRDITDAQEALLGAETDLLRAAVDYNIALAELEANIAAPIQ